MARLTRSSRARRGASKLLLLLLAGCATTAAPPEGKERALRVAFVDVSVVPMDSERVLAGQTVLVEGEEIREVGPVGEVRVPPDALRVEGRGRYLTPGLADMHVHLKDLPELVSTVAHGVTTVRNMWGTQAILEWRGLVRSGRALGPDIYSSGPLMDGAPPRWEAALAVEDAEEARREVRRQKAAGYDFIKVYDGLQPEVFRAIAEEARAQALPVVGHPPLALALEEAAAMGQVSLEHLYGLEALALRPNAPLREVRTHLHRWEAWQHADAALLAPVAKRLAELGAWACPTLITFTRFGDRPTSERLYREQLPYLTPLLHEPWNPSKAYASEAARSVAEAFRQGRPNRLAATRELHRAGVRLLLGTDAGNRYIVAGATVHDELDELVAAGLSPYEALRTGTVNAAEFLGKAEAFGTVAPKKRADLLLVEGNPLEDVRHLRRRAGVMVRGRWYPEAELRARLEGIAQGYRQLAP